MDKTAPIYLQTVMEIINKTKEKKVSADIARLEQRLEEMEKKQEPVWRKLLSKVRRKS